ncbi:hypothetical protein ACIGEZ_03730 [Streptomyces sp. NPDC085481]|uniref:hypothetical protein n=1 Tax=Streptomyces sp. NPDC085481 TaxID=3365727 RepID=UPI0037D3514A
MAISPSALVLRGSGGTVLRHETDGALTLRRGDEEHRIPLQAVRGVLPDGRSVSVQLRAPGGAQPVVHRVDGVSEAAVEAFAEAVNLALLELPEPDPSTDGATLVTTRNLAESQPPKQPLLKSWAFWLTAPVLTLLLAQSVAVVVAGEPALLVLIWILGVIGWVLTAVSAYTAERAFMMWWLPRHGVTVMAEFAFRIPSTRVYEYTDLNGETHRYRKQYGGSRAEVSYHPRKPATVIGNFSVVARLWVALLALLLCGATLGLFGLLCVIAFTA